MTSITYLIYIACSILITVLVTHTLSKNDKIYLIDGFSGDEALSTSINHMLIVGFYLLNLGFVLLRMQTGAGIESTEHMIVYLSSGLGSVLVALGAIHFFLMHLIH
ncbi:MAG: hypothetical protein ACJAX5_000061 [Patiriisocius sp.]|jgi:hypothetical protein